MVALFVQPKSIFRRFLEIDLEGRGAARANETDQSVDVMNPEERAQDLLVPKLYPHPLLGCRVLGLKVAAVLHEALPLGREAG